MNDALNNLASSGLRLIGTDYRDFVLAAPARRGPDGDRVVNVWTVAQSFTPGDETWFGRLSIYDATVNHLHGLPVEDTGYRRADLDVQGDNLSDCLRQIHQREMSGG